MSGGLSVREVHLDGYLTNLARLYRPAEDGFVADELCPRLPVAKESDKYPVWDTGPFFGAGDDLDADLLGDRTPVRRLEFTWSDSGYLCEERALGFDISPRERANADQVLRLEMNKQRGTLGRLSLLRERRVARLLQDTSQTGGQIDASFTAASAARWDASATTYANIRGDIMTGIQLIRQTIGVNPNVIVLPQEVAEGLTATAFYGDIVRWNVSNGQNPDLTRFTDAIVLPSRIFGLRTVVAGAIYDSANEGAAASMAEVWGETVRIMYVTNGPSIENPSVAYTFQSQAPATRRWTENDPELDVFKVSNGVIDERVVAPKAAYTVTNCLT